MRLPFYHMRSDGFWTPLDVDGKVSASRETAALAQLDPSFLECAEDAGLRFHVRADALSDDCHRRIHALDAAHIQQFKRGGPCEPSNGIALSKTAHWLFDRGFWSITDDYRVVVKSGAFEEAGEASQLLKPHSGRQILLPNNRGVWPNPLFLGWHRANHGFAAYQ